MASSADAMAATATPLRARRASLVARVRSQPLVATAAGLALLVGLSVALRTQVIDAKLWIDEGLSIGIASHSLVDIPGLLRQDGSPPFYYLLLAVWTDVVGDGETRTHALSLLFAVASVPVAFWAGRAVFDTRAAWACAALAAFNPYLTYYAQETRMYALVTLLSIAVSGTFALAFALRRRRALPAFVLLAALLAYTHNWGLFLLAGTAVAAAVLAWNEHGAARRALARDGAMAFGALGVLYAPWLPSLISQARHTGAPWAERPGFDAVVNGFSGVLGGEAPAVLGLFVAVVGIGTLARAGRGRPDPRVRATVAIGVALAVGVLLAFFTSLISPAWATRYMAVFIGPLVLLLGVGLTRYGRVGVAALVIVLLFWLDGRERELRGKGDAYRVATVLKEAGYVRPGALVLNTHPEHGPVMRYYLGDGLRWANALGPVADPWIFDWRDALDELQARGPIRVARQVLPQLRPGEHLLLIQPIIRTGRWGAPWTRLVRRRAAQWERVVSRTEGLVRVAPLPAFEGRRLPRGVRAVVYRRTAGPLRLPAPR